MEQILFPSIYSEYNVRKANKAACGVSVTNFEQLEKLRHNWAAKYVTQLFLKNTKNTPERFATLQHE